MATNSFITEKATDIIRKHILISMGAGAIPVPIIDIGVVTVVQLEMLKQLCKLYDVNYEEKAGKSIITAILGNALVRIGASMVKLIPLYGSLVGSFSMGVISGASTYALGQVFVNQLETGSDLFSFDIGKAKKMYDKEFEQGKEVVSKLKEEQEAQKNKVSEIVLDGDTLDVFAKLDKLGELRDSGILTEEEFQAKKTDLLERI